MGVAGIAAVLLSPLFYLDWDISKEEAPAAQMESSTVTGGEFTQETIDSTGATSQEDNADTDIDVLWEVIDEASVAELPPYKEIVQDRVLVRMTNFSSALRIGQRIAITIPQVSETYTPVVERIEPGPGGVRSYLGTLTEATDRAHQFTITIGVRNTFAHLPTPLGTYELVATGELGWLMPTINMDQHVDYSKPDYIVPEVPRILPR